MRVHNYVDALRITVQGKVITITPQFFITHSNMKNNGVIIRNNGDELTMKYKLNMLLPERFFGDKFSTHWPDIPRILQFAMAKLKLV